MAAAATLRSARPVFPSRRHAERRLDGERLALGLTAAATAMLPLLAPGGPGNSAPVDLLIGLALASCLLWTGRTRARLRFPYAVAAFLLLAGGTLGALAGPVPRAGAIALVQDVWLVVWCWTLVNIASSPRRLGVVLGAWAYGALAWTGLLFLGLGLGIPFLTGQTATQGSRTMLTFGDPSYSASYYVISILIIWATGRPRRRGVRLTAYALLVAAVVSTGSNSGTVSLVAGVGAAAVLGVRARAGLAPAVALAATLLTAALALALTVDMDDVQQRAKRSQYAFLRDGVGRGAVSVSHRDKLFEEGVQLYRTGGLLGQGPASTKPRLRTELAPFVKEAHDDYIAALIERGVLGFAGLMLLVAGLAVRIVPLATARLADGFAAVVPRPHALVGAVLGMLLAATVYELLHVRHAWALFAIVAAIHAWGRR